jgi:hypothetical protein
MKRYRELARHKCKDCGVNVIKIGEYYMVSPQLWEDKLRNVRQSLHRLP